MRGIFVLLGAIVMAILVNACNNTATSSSSTDTASSRSDSVKLPAVTEGGIKDTTMHGFDSTRSK